MLSDILSCGFMWLNTYYGLNKINTADYSVEHYYGDFSGEVKYDKKEKVLWIASNDLRKFNPKTRLTEYYQIFTGKDHDIIQVNSIQIDEDGLLWLGTNCGLMIFDKSDNQFYSIDQYFEKAGLASGNV